VVLTLSNHWTASDTDMSAAHLNTNFNEIAAKFGNGVTPGDLDGGALQEVTYGWTVANSAASTALDYWIGIADAADNNLYLPAGTWRMTATSVTTVCDLLTGMTIVGAGIDVTIIKPMIDCEIRNPLRIQSSKSFITLANLTLNDNLDAETYGSLTNAELLTIYAANGVNIKNVRLQNVKFNASEDAHTDRIGLYFDIDGTGTINDTLVENCQFQVEADDANFCIYSADILNNLHVKNCTFNTGGRPCTVGKGTAEDNDSYIVIEGCRFQLGYYDDIYGGISVAGPGLIRNNVFSIEANQAAMTLKYFIAAKNKSNRPLIIEDNLLYPNVDDEPAYGIQCTGIQIFVNRNKDAVFGLRGWGHISRTFNTAMIDLTNLKRTTSEAAAMGNFWYDNFAVGGTLYTGNSTTSQTSKMAFFGQGRSTSEVPYGYPYHASTRYHGINHEGDDLFLGDVQLAFKQNSAVTTDCQLHFGRRWNGTRDIGVFGQRNGIWQDSAYLNVVSGAALL